MIRIDIYKSKGEYSRISAYGHAEYDDEGKDIVCAAVSVLFINLANSVESFTEDLFSSDTFEDGTSEILLKENISEKTTLLIDSFILGIKGIEAQYGNEYLSIDYKEV